MLNAFCFVLSGLLYVNIDIVAGHPGVPELRGPVQAGGGDGDVPVPGGEGAAAGPEQGRRVFGRAGLRAPDPQVRGCSWLVQGTGALPLPRPAQHLPRIPHLREDLGCYLKRRTNPARRRPQ